MDRPIGNAEIAETLEEVANLLQAQQASPFRVRAYEGAARYVRASSRPMADILALEGTLGLERLPAIGARIALSIREILETGHLRYLKRLEGEAPVESLLMKVPGIGFHTAHRLHTELGIDTLEDLELSAYDGRLHRFRGFGPRKIQALKDVLSTMLLRSSRRGRAQHSVGEQTARPDVTTLLSVDEEYRQKARAGVLRKLAPKRFNANQEAWLPILHTERDGFHFTALFSNTARAHELRMTQDWVVLFHDKDGQEGQCTVVTERSGPESGQRVVRGREEECAAYRAAAGSAA